MGLAGVLDNLQPEFRRDRTDLGHLRRQAVEMHRHNRPRTVARSVHARLQILAQTLRAEISGVRIDIDKDR